jgi:outer membrane protein TolC
MRTQTHDLSANKKMPCQYGKQGSGGGSRAWTHRLRARHFPAYLAAVILFAIPLSGCTTLSEYLANGFKVGPNYGRPPVPVAKDWIDVSDKRIRTESDDLSKWWTVFKDPVLDSLICYAYQQNLTLRQAGYRVLEARAQLGIDVGNLLPQTQAATGAYTRTAATREGANSQFSPRRFFSQWDYGFKLAWELGSPRTSPR